MKASRSELTPEQQKLVEDNMECVRIIALRVCRGLPRQVRVDDLISAGYMGLIECALRFDESRGVPFRGYAQKRIKGAMKDWMRGEDLLTREERRTRGDAIDRKEIEINPRKHAIPENKRNVEQLDAEIDVNRLVGKLKRFYPRWAFVVERNLAGRKLKEIGKELGVNESRTSQIRSNAIAFMRAAA